MSKADKNGWHSDIDNVPNDIFDVIAKYYDAGLDTFLMARFTGCFQNDGRIFMASCFPGSATHVDLLENGYRPTHWRRIPKPPVDWSANTHEGG